MQVTYKTISSYEYDVASGIYKKVDKEVEDTSASNQSFSDILESSDKAEQSSSKSSFEATAGESSYALNSSMYAYRFRQNEDTFSLKANESSNNNASSDENSLLNDILKAL